MTRAPLLEPKFISQVKFEFQAVSTVSDLALLLNIIENYLSQGEKSKIKFTERNLHYVFIKKSTMYSEISIPKKNGEKRQILAPSFFLKRVQAALSTLIQIIFIGSENYNSNGFILGRSIKRNAIPHVNKRYLLNVDLENFFPSIEFRRVKTVLELSPFCLNKNRENLAFIIANIVTYNGILPQGAPTSPVISNVVCQKLDRKLTRLSKKYKTKYSRYADDITFSSNVKVFDSKFFKELSDIIFSENFKLNNSKTRLKSSLERQEVTGLIVNKKVNVKREYYRSVKAMLNNWEIHGLEYATARFKSFQSKEQHSVGFQNSLQGKINFIGIIKGNSDPLYKRLRNKYQYIANKIDYSSIQHEGVRKKLEDDNYQMESVLFNKDRIDENEFIIYCTSAFHQVENLLNYFYYSRFSSIDDLKNFMWNENVAFRNQWKSLKKYSSEERCRRLGKYKKVSDFNINTLVYLFEKEFCYGQGRYYESIIEILREIRNDGSHRSTVYDLNRNRIQDQYKELLAKEKAFLIRHGRSPVRHPGEMKIVKKNRLVEFLNNFNFKIVRETILMVLKYTVDCSLSDVKVRTAKQGNEL